MLRSLPALTEVVMSSLEAESRPSSWLTLEPRPRPLSWGFESLLKCRSYSWKSRQRPLMRAGPLGYPEGQAPGALVGILPDAKRTHA